MDKQGKAKPYLLLKFGSIKGGDFRSNKKALELYTEGNKVCVNDEDFRKNDIKVIDLFKGDFIKWWGSVNLTKEEAKDYILTYKDE